MKTFVADECKASFHHRAQLFDKNPYDSHDLKSPYECGLKCYNTPDCLQWIFGFQWTQWNCYFYSEFVPIEEPTDTDKGITAGNQLCPNDECKCTEETFKYHNRDLAEVEGGNCQTNTSNYCPFCYVEANSGCADVTRSSVGAPLPLSCLACPNSYLPPGGSHHQPNHV